MGTTDGETMTLVIGGWELRDTAEGAGDALALSTGDSQEWLAAVVPGGVHPTLIAAGRLPDPFADDNLSKHRWVENRDWWYRARFDAEAGDVRITADGLDTIAELFIDGRSIGHHANQFRPAEFDVTLETGGEHVMLIRFSRPLPHSPEAEENGNKGAARVAAGLRKATFSWGWDFGPRLPSIGLSGDIIVERAARPRLAAPHAHTSFLASDHSRARVVVSVEVENLEAAGAVPLSVDAVLTSPGGTAHAQSVAVVDGSATVELIVDDPDLWWTHDLGRPALHDLRVDLRSTDGIVDTYTSRVGIRTIDLSRPIDPVDGGRLFQFVLNGVPVFTRGANWVPPSPLVGVVDAPLRHELVQRAAEGGMSMLRVWGGGIYEHDVFYDACDELGILVWQDFMFACVDYPGDDLTFAAEVEIEARHQIRRLRSRACLALWCGNNETEALAAIFEHDSGTSAGEWGHHLFHTVLPRALDGLDDVTAYWPGSPWGETTDELNGFRDGDRHSWEVWHGREGGPFFTELADLGDRPGDARHWRRYAADTGRFITEFGILSAPNRETFDRWMPGAQLHDDVFDTHLTDRPGDKIEQIMEIATGLPECLEQYIDSSQTVQAEAILFAVEHFRRRQPRTAGTLVWQLNDCWPGMTWSLLDVDGTPKAAYYAMARASAPLAVSIAEDGEGGVEVWLVNNTRQRRQVPIDIEIGTFDGADRVRQQIIGEAEAGTSVLVWSTTAAADERHYVWASSPDDAFPIARKHFVDPGALQIDPPSLSWSVDGPYLDLVSEGYSYGIRISHPEPTTRLSDNWFDMRDGDRRRILVQNADPALLRVGPSRLQALEHRKEDA